MDTRKITFLILIFLFVMVISNYMSVEGFETKKQRDARKKKEKDKKARAKAAVKATNARAKAAAKATRATANAAANAAAEIKRMDEIKKLIATQIAASGAPGASSVNKTEFDKMMNDVQSIKTEINNTASSVKKSDSDIKSIAENIKTQLSGVSNTSKNVENVADNVITKINGNAASIDKSVETNRKIGEDIDKKIVAIGSQVSDAKTQVDKVIDVKTQVDKVMDEFQKGSALMLARMNVASDNNAAKNLVKQGFQNMDGVKPNAKQSAFTTVNTAYDGKMNLEGFSTEADSAYLKNSDLFALEQDVIAKLKTFNEKYYGYQMCLRKNNYKSLSCAIGNKTNVGLNDVNSAKNDVITSSDALNSAIVRMNAKTSLAPGQNGTGKKMSQVEFETRHNQIKDTATRVSVLRAELDMKMANLLDKTKGPLPEAQNKYNAENYVTIGWTILATSLVYYVFVEMK